MTNKKLLELVEFLQDNTNLAEMLSGYGISDDKTDNYPEGDYATIERWLKEQIEYRREY